MEKPTKTHMQARKRILRNLRETSTLKFIYRKYEEPKILGERDADWSGNHGVRKSTTGFCFKYGKHSSAISWQERRKFR